MQFKTAPYGDRFAYRVSKVIKYHPLATFKQLTEDKNTAIRFLSEDEERRLRQALIDRDHKAIKERVSANQWRLQRGYHLQIRMVLK